MEKILNFIKNNDDKIYFNINKNIVFIKKNKNKYELSFYDEIMDFDFLNDKNYKYLRIFFNNYQFIISKTKNKKIGFHDNKITFSNLTKKDLFDLFKKVEIFIDKYD